MLTMTDMLFITRNQSQSLFHAVSLLSRTKHLEIKCAVYCKYFPYKYHATEVSCQKTLSVMFPQNNRISFRYHRSHWHFLKLIVLNHIQRNKIELIK